MTSVITGAQSPSVFCRKSCADGYQGLSLRSCIQRQSQVDAEHDERWLAHCSTGDVRGKCVNGHDRKIKICDQRGHVRDIIKASILA